MHAACIWEKSIQTSLLFLLIANLNSDVCLSKRLCVRERKKRSKNESGSRRGKTTPDSGKKKESRINSIAIQIYQTLSLFSRRKIVFATFLLLAHISLPMNCGQQFLFLFFNSPRNIRLFLLILVRDIPLNISISKCAHIVHKKIRF